MCNGCMPQKVSGPSASIFTPVEPSVLKESALAVVRRRSTITFSTPVFRVRAGEGDNERILYIHEEILKRSPVLKAAIAPSWKASLTHEIDMSDDDPQAVALFFEYLYLRRGTRSPLYKLVRPAVNLSRADLMEEADLQVRIYCLADKYAVLGLQAAARANIDLCMKDGEACVQVARDVSDRLPAEQHGKLVEAIQKALIFHSRKTPTLKNLGNMLRIYAKDQEI